MQYRRPLRGFTANAIANIRQRYEDTDEPQSSIAADFGVHRKTIETLAKTQGWTLRKDRAQRDLPPDLRLALKADRAVQAVAEARVAMAQAGEVEARQAEGRAGAPARPSVVDRLERAVEKELAAVEIARAMLGSQPQPPADVERTSRILERLTDTLFKVRRLRSPDLPIVGADNFDDMPQDTDAFRHALARRIEAFVRGWTDDRLHPAGESASAASPQQ